MIKHLTDRPCAVCEFHKENGCSKWSCVFEQEPTTKNDLGVDCIDRQATLDAIIKRLGIKNESYLLPAERNIYQQIKDMPAVTPRARKGYCKDCKYFEYDSMAMVDGMPLIVAHEICSKWGNGCKTSENGYCFLFEPKADMREVEE